MKIENWRHDRYLATSNDEHKLASEDFIVPTMPETKHGRQGTFELPRIRSPNQLELPLVHEVALPDDLA